MGNNSPELQSPALPDAPELARQHYPDPVVDGSTWLYDETGRRLSLGDTQPGVAKAATEDISQDWRTKLNPYLDN